MRHPPTTLKIEKFILAVIQYQVDPELIFKIQVKNVENTFFYSQPPINNFVLASH